MNDPASSPPGSWPFAASLALALALAGCGETTITITEPEPDAPSDVDLERGLLLYLPFDETAAGTIAADASGHGHDGAPSADPPVPSLSLPPVGFPNARSLSFDGVGQLVELGNPETLDITGGITVSAWIRPLADDGYRNVVAHGFRSVPAQEVALRIRGKNYDFLWWDGMDHLATAPMPEGDLDSWHHLCGVYDGRSYRIYRDGELLAARLDNVAPMHVEASWAVGGRLASDGVGSRFFAGLVDDVRVYDRPLSDVEVRALFRR